MIRNALLATGLLAAVPAWAAPSRIMSLNLCADQLVLALAPPSTITSVSYLARDCQISVACEATARIPINYGTAEEVIAQAPDLIVAGRYTTRPTVAIARKFAYAVEDLDVPNTIEAVQAQIRQVASAVGNPAGGETMIAAMDRALSALPPPSGDAPHPLAAVFETSGFTVGRGSLIDTLLTRAGFDNLATRLGIDNYPSLPLEALVMGQPDLLIMEVRHEARPSLGGAMLEHPILAAGFPLDRQTAVPQKLWICGGPSIVDAMRILTAARERIEAKTQ
jgi:iron complex transport system substrate-binding protein